MPVLGASCCGYLVRLRVRRGFAGSGAAGAPPPGSMLALDSYFAISSADTAGADTPLRADTKADKWAAATCGTARPRSKADGRSLLRGQAALDRSVTAVAGSPSVAFFSCGTRMSSAYSSASGPL